MYWSSVNGMDAKAKRSFDAQLLAPDRSQLSTRQRAESIRRAHGGGLVQSVPVKRRARQEVPRG